MLNVKKTLSHLLQNALLPSSGLVQNSGTVTVNSARAFTLATVNLEPNTLYLILGSVQSSVSYTTSQLCQLTSTGSQFAYGSSASRSTGSNGGGTKNWIVVGTGTGTATATVSCYGYYTTSHTETGQIVAIPLCKLGG